MFHVALPALYLREHRIPVITTNFLASLFIEVDFGTPENIDRVTADCTPDQGETRMTLDGIPAKLEVTRASMPERLRRAALRN